MSLASVANMGCGLGTGRQLVLSDRRDKSMSGVSSPPMYQSFFRSFVRTINVWAYYGVLHGGVFPPRE